MVHYSHLILCQLYLSFLLLSGLCPSSSNTLRRWSPSLSSNTPRLCSPCLSSALSLLPPTNRHPPSNTLCCCFTGLSGSPAGPSGSAPPQILRIICSPGLSGSSSAPPPLILRVVVPPVSPVPPRPPPSPPRLPPISRHGRLVDDLLNVPALLLLLPVLRWAIPRGGRRSLLVLLLKTHTVTHIYIIIYRLKQYAHR
jgi:hypothetical protein